MQRCRAASGRRSNGSRSEQAVREVLQDLNGAVKVDNLRGVLRAQLANETDRRILRDSIRFSMLALVSIRIMRD